MSELLVNTIKKADGTGSLTVPAESGTVVTTASPSLGRRNLIINGDFQVSQRGDFTTASSSTAGAYFVDRWLSNQDGVTANKQHLYSQTINSDITANTIKIIATSSGTANMQLSQPIEQINNQLANKTITYSVWVKSNNSNCKLRGIFDNANGWTEYNDAVHTGDGTWQKLTTTINVGADRTGGHYQIQIIIYDAGNTTITSGDYIEIAQPQVEIGSVATPFEHRSYGEELALCQRYYQSFFGARMPLVQYQANFRTLTHTFPQMRAIPTVTYDTNNGAPTFGWPAGSINTSSSLHMWLSRSYSDTNSINVHDLALEAEL